MNTKITQSSFNNHLFNIQGILAHQENIKVKKKMHNGRNLFQDELETNEQLVLGIHEILAFWNDTRDDLPLFPPDLPPGPALPRPLAPPSSKPRPRPPGPSSLPLPLPRPTPGGLRSEKGNIN